MTKKSNRLEWLQNEIAKDSISLNKEKEEFINSIKKYNREDLLPKKPKKLTIWQRIMKVLAG
jgi:protein tyrosine/serine phosphatase